MKIKLFAIQSTKYQSLLIKTSAFFDIFMLVLPFWLPDLAKIVFDAFLALYIWIILNCILIGITGLSLVYLFIFRKNTNKWKLSLPFLLNGFTVFILTSTQFVGLAGNFREKIELQANKPKYIEIVQKVNSGEIEPNNDEGYIKLSENLGDFILVNKKNNIISVFFNVFSFNNYSGFIYRSDDSQPPANLMDNYWIDCRHEEKYWYYCSSLD